MNSVVLSNPGINETIRRTRGQITVSAGASGPISCTVGFMVANDLAVTAGAASLPGPVTDASDDSWFVWVPILFQAVSGQQVLEFQMAFDSKAMRRVEEGYSVAIMLENNSPVVTIDVAIAFSILASIT